MLYALTKTMKYLKTLGEQCNILVCKNIHVCDCVYTYMNEMNKLTELMPVKIAFSQFHGQGFEMGELLF